MRFLYTTSTSGQVEEALRFARNRKQISNQEILYFARLLRQVQVITPSLKSVT